MHSASGGWREEGTATQNSTGGSWQEGQHDWPQGETEEHKQAKSIW